MRIKYEVVYRAWNRHKGAEFWKSEGDYSTRKHAFKHAKKLIGTWPERCLGFLTGDDVRVEERLEEFPEEGMLVTPGNLLLRVRAPEKEVPIVLVRRIGRKDDGYVDFEVSIRSLEVLYREPEPFGDRMLRPQPYPYPTDVRPEDGGPNPYPTPRLVG